MSEQKSNKTLLKKLQRAEQEIHRLQQERHEEFLLEAMNLFVSFLLEAMDFLFGPLELFQKGFV